MAGCVQACAKSALEPSSEVSRTRFGMHTQSIEAQQRQGSPRGSVIHRSARTRDYKGREGASWRTTLPKRMTTPSSSGLTWNVKA